MRKHFGEVVTVSQEVQDIISSPIVKEAIINNSDCKILLDQRKFMNRFDSIQTLLGLTNKEKSQILSINMSNHPGRVYKEVWIGLGGVQSAVYATEVSRQEYLAYTTEETEKLEVQRLADTLGGDMELAIKQLTESQRKQTKPCAGVMTAYSRPRFHNSFSRFRMSSDGGAAVKERLRSAFIAKSNGAAKVIISHSHIEEVLSSDDLSIRIKERTILICTAVCRCPTIACGTY